jgi:hypothetical protein
MRKYISTVTLSIVVILLHILVACSSSVQATDPVSVTRGFFDAINKGQGQKAANCFDEDGELIWAHGQPKGSKRLLEYMQKQLIPLKTRVEIKDLKADGENVTGTFTITSTYLASEFPNGVPLMKVIAVVQSGKIKSMTWTTNK